MDFKRQILEIIGLAFEINESTSLHINVDYIGLMGTIRVYVYNKSEGFGRLAKEVFAVRRDKPILNGDVTFKEAVIRLKTMLKESEVSA